MPLSHEHVGPKILAKIKIYILARAKLLFHLCCEIPCTIELSLTFLQSSYFSNESGHHFTVIFVEKRQGINTDS